jgi:hypothetical protein
LPAFGGWAGREAYTTEFLEGALGGSLVGVETALEALEAVFEVIEGGAKRVLAAEGIPFVGAIVRTKVVELQLAIPEVGFDGFVWYIEPGYEYDFGRGHERSIGMSVGLLTGITKR